QRIMAGHSPLEEIEELERELFNLLDREDVLPIKSDTSRYDRESQQAISFCATERPELHNAVSSVVRPGFRQGRRVLRPEMVVLHRCPSLSDGQAEIEGT